MTMQDDPLDHVAVALDTRDWQEFDRWCKTFGPRVGVLKVGLEAFCRWGEKAVELARAQGKRLFLDLKLHDIPNTAAGAAEAARDMGADYLTLHVAGGEAMIAAAVERCAGEVQLLAVTLLTHLDEAGLKALGLEGEAEERISSWARQARVWGCAGAVCSPREVARLRRENGEPFVLVTPGIRGGGEVSGDDQRRTATPREALAAGSSLLVIGRPLTRAIDADEALTALRLELVR
jgi:orotidine-5'-phosphate decarboxylase